MKKIIIYTTVLLAITINKSGYSQCLDEEKIPDQYIVKLETQTWLQMKSFFSTFSVEENTSWTNLNVSAELDPDKIKSTFIRFKGKKHQLNLINDYFPLATIEQDCLVSLERTPNDSQFKQQWAHKVTQAELAWNYGVGSPSIVVAVSDSGVDYRHTDLRYKMWINQKEQRGKPGVDDDNNGCIDDIYGCDTADRDGDPRPGSLDSGAHGTHVAGIIAAQANNGIGVAGVAWNTRIMAVKSFSNYMDQASTSDLLEGIYYAVNNGANVINCSWGGGGSASSATKEAFNYAQSKGVTVVVAAGNSSMDTRYFTPASLNNLITVGSSNSRDELSTFSNYGYGVDIVAPGGDLARNYGGVDETIISTVPGNQYKGFRGTSMAAPYVSGTVALMLSVNPRLSPYQVDRLLKQSSDVRSMVVPSQRWLSYRYPRVNVYKAIKAAYQSR